MASVGEASSIADEVNDVLAGYGLSPNDDLEDIVSDAEEEEEEEEADEYKDSSDGKLF